MLLVQKIFAINSAVESETINHDNCPSTVWVGIPVFRYSHAGDLEENDYRAVAVRIVQSTCISGLE